MEKLKVKTGRYETSLCRYGHGEVILFIHGSGPGATGLSNWQLALPELGRDFLGLAPDLLGYGESEHPDPPPRGARAWMRLWVEQLLALLEALEIEGAHLVGNSLGGAIALHLLMEAPERFRRVVLMGPAGAPFRIPPELDRIWGFYEAPTLSAMKNAIRWFAYDEGFIRDRLEEIARMRLEAALRPEVRRYFSSTVHAQAAPGGRTRCIPPCSSKGVNRGIPWGGLKVSPGVDHSLNRDPREWTAASRGALPERSYPQRNVRTARDDPVLAILSRSPP